MADETRHRERLTISLDPTAAHRVRQCSHGRGGASGYIERLVRADAMAEAVAQGAEWFVAHPGYADDADAERAAADGAA